MYACVDIRSNHKVRQRLSTSTVLTAPVGCSDLPEFVRRVTRLADLLQSFNLVLTVTSVSSGDAALDGSAGGQEQRRISEAALAQMILRQGLLCGEEGE